jgi:hypothetical protein
MTVQKNEAASHVIRVNGHLVTLSCRYLYDLGSWESSALIHPAGGTLPDVTLTARDRPGTADDALDVAADLAVAWMRIDAKSRGTALAF